MRMTIPTAFVLCLFLGARDLPASPISFDGNNIEATAFFPELPPNATFIGGPKVAVVGPGIEFAAGDFLPFLGANFDFSGTTITNTFNPLSDVTIHAAGVFNGYRFFDIDDSLNDFIGVEILSDSTGFFSGAPERIFWDANNIYMNFQGLTFESGTNPVIVLGVQFAPSLAEVPEPTSIAIWSLVGLATLAACRRRKGGTGKSQGL